MACIAGALSAWVSVGARAARACAAGAPALTVLAASTALAAPTAPTAPAAPTAPTAPAAIAAPTAPAVHTALTAYARGTPVAQTAPPHAVGTWWDRTSPGKGRKPPSSKYYSVRSDLPIEETRQWAQHLDTMYEEFTRRLVHGGGLKRRTPEVLNVLIFARQQDYLDTLRTQFGLNAMGSGGMFFITPRGGGLAFFTENLSAQRVAHVAQHEGFHQFAHAFFGNDIPPWLNEGLAEFFGECVVENGKVIIGQASPQVIEIVRAAAASGKHVPFVELLQMDDARWNAAVRAGTAALQYQQSWSMVHFLVYGDNSRYQGAFQNMLQLLNAGTRPYEAMRKAFGLTTDADVLDFERAWVEHAKNAQPSSYVAARARLEFLAEGLRSVWGRGQRPATIEDLRRALVDAGFTYPMSAHGYTLVLKATDEANFTVPQDATNPKPIVLELAASPAPRTAAGKKLEAEHPTPPIIRTRGLQPRELRALWSRRADLPEEWTYDIGSK